MRRLLLILLALSLPALAQQKHTLAISGDHFTLDNKPFQIISGELHYARIPPQYWHARLKMAKAMGLNTIATYVFWNAHEPSPNHFDFSGQNDLAAFIRAAQEEGLFVLLRAGPYSCAEWEFGGFPAWLLKDPAMSHALRTNDPAFIVPAQRWLTRLAQETAPLLLVNGGPILAVQIENEYGNFGNEPGYMQHMLQIFQSTPWKDSFLYTVDPSKALANGMLPGIFAGVNFGTGSSEQAIARITALRPGQPLFATEYWPGWFDLFGHPHETRPVAPQLKDIENVLSRNGSINIYMVHGGTTFGMMNGASASTGNYRGNVTSYDYDAPIDEAGHPTPKFFAYRDLILKYTHQPALPIPATKPVIAIPPFTLTATSSIWTNLPVPTASENPLTMEQVDQAYGYILYRHRVTMPLVDQVLTLDPVHDYAQVFLDDKLVGTLDRHYNQTSVTLNTAQTVSVLNILVENTGRLNSTKHIRDEWKGLRTATLNGQPLTDWQIYPLLSPPGVWGSAVLTQVPRSKSKPTRSGIDAHASRYPDPSGSGSPTSFGGGALAPGANISSTPHFASGSFTLKQTGDTFLDISQLGKGLIWINGHPLGRFWNIGPQQTLYVPASWLKKGYNIILIFDLFPAPTAQKLIGRTTPILDGPTPTYATDPERKKKADPNAEFGPKLTTPVPKP